MPYLRVVTSAIIGDAEKEILRDGLAGIMGILPGKSRENTMIQIEDGASLTMGDSGEPCAFVDLRLFKASPFEAKARFVHAVGSMLKERLGVDPGRIYLNIVELPYWGVGGEYKS